MPNSTSTPSGDSGPSSDGLSRRSFLRNSAVLVSGLAALAASLSPLRHLNDFPSVDQFLQKYYKELTPEEMAKVLKRIEDEVEKQYGLRPHVRDLKPMNGVEFVYALNLTRCIGCRKCVHACVGENNQSRTPEIQYIRVVRLPHGSLDLEKAEHNYNPEMVPEKGYFYMPVQCQQCKNPHVKISLFRDHLGVVVVLRLLQVQRPMRQPHHSDVLDLRIPRLVVLPYARVDALATADAPRQVQRIDELDPVHRLEVAHVRAQSVLPLHFVFDALQHLGHLFRGQLLVILRKELVHGRKIIQMAQRGQARGQRRQAGSQNSRTAQKTPAAQPVGR